MSPYGPTMSSMLDQSRAVCAQNPCYKRQSFYQKNVFKHLSTIFVQLCSSTELMLLPIMSGIDLSVCPHDARQSKSQQANPPSGYAQGQLASYQPKALFIKVVVVVEAGWPASKSELETWVK